MAIETDTGDSSASLPYHEPSRVTILTQASFLLLLNVVNFAVDKVLYCGLVAQIFLGIAFGVPGADWLGREAERTMVQVGYLGLILMVYEGGLSTNLPRLVANAGLSTLVAMIGITVPIALSFLLGPIAGATSIQCFAAGAALSATSLGTTFSVLSSAGLTDTRLGTILTSAAMMDDVIGLVMIAIVANLGKGTDAGTVAGRPIGASVGLLLVVVLGSRFAVGPIGRWWVSKQCLSQQKPWDAWLDGAHTAFIAQTLLLVGFVAIAAWAGTSVLFAAFLSGAVVTWWDTQIVATIQQDPPIQGAEGAVGVSKEGSNTTPGCPLNMQLSHITGKIVYEQYYQAVVEKVFKPLFFASIGFSIPITQMFAGKIIWRGIVYALLMFVGKAVAGLPIWATKFSLRSSLSLRGAKSKATLDPARSLSSLYPPVIVGFAMVARGEIGFLVAAVAQSNGIFSASDLGPQALYIIVVWAIVVCTITGPVGVGGFVRGAKRQDSALLLGLWGTGAK